MMRKRVPQMTEKVLDMDASMQGTMTFKDPVNLNINGAFEGTLDAKGTLTIGETASVNAEIRGDTVIIAGKLRGHVYASKLIKISPPAEVNADIYTPILVIEEGAIFNGRSTMNESVDDLGIETTSFLSLEDLSEYLDVDKKIVTDWAESGRLPGIKENNIWRFKRETIDEWLTKEKVQ